MRRTSASAWFHASPTTSTPALLTHTSSWPRAVAARAIARCDSGSRTSCGNEHAPPPSADAVALAAASSMSVTSTSYPLRARRSAILRPSPRPAPVTTATGIAALLHDDGGARRDAGAVDVVRQVLQHDLVLTGRAVDRAHRRVRVIALQVGRG